MLITIKPSRSSEDEEETCVEEKEISEVVPHTPNTLNRPTDNNQASNSTTLPKYNNNWRGHQDNRTRNLVKYVEERIILLQSVTSYYRYEYNTKNENTQQTLAALTINEESDPNFYVDSGATTHMTNLILAPTLFLLEMDNLYL